MDMLTQPPLFQVWIPLLNPNEVEGVLASLKVQNRQKVEAGAVLAVFETTKSTVDLVAERSGFILGLELAEGQTMQAGELLCYIADEPDSKLPAIKKTGASTIGQADHSSDVSLPAGLRITRPALALARQLGVDLAGLPTGALVTEAQVRRQAGEKASPLIPSLARLSVEINPGGQKPAVIIYGGGGHGKSLIELIRLLDTFDLVGVLDDGLPAGMDLLGVPVLGGQAVLSELYQRGIHLAINAVGGIGHLEPRLQVFERLERACFSCPKVIHPTAFVEASAQLADGVQVFAHAYVGSCVEVGFGSIINTGAIISHDCRLKEYVNLSPGAILAGGVEVGSKTLIGMGVTINLEVKIGKDVRIGNSATIKKDIPDGSVVRAGTIWPADH